MFADNILKSMNLRSYRASFIFLTLALGGGLCLLLSGVACLFNRPDIAVYIGWAYLISLLCFIPSYYTLAWAFSRSGQAMYAVMTLGVPIRFALAIALLLVIRILNLTDPTPVALWLCLFYPVLLVLESRILIKNLPNTLGVLDAHKEVC